MSDKPLPCPFCGGLPNLDPIGRVRCTTWGCPPSRDWSDPRCWNTRAPAAEPAVGEVAHHCVTVAIEGVAKMVPEDADGRWLQACAIQNLQQALAALRPPAAPVSVAFWLGSDA